MRNRFISVFLPYMAVFLVLSACTTSGIPAADTEPDAGVSLAPETRPPTGEDSGAPPPEPLASDAPGLSSEVFLKGEFELRGPEEFIAERARIDIGNESSPLVLELGWLPAADISPPDEERDFFVHILSVNGTAADPVLAEPATEGEDACFFYHIQEALALDLNGDGQKELVLYFPIGLNGGNGGGYISVFAYKDGRFERLPVPRYLYGNQDIRIEWFEEKSLRISCDDPVFQFTADFIELPYEGMQNYGDEGNWADPVYGWKVIGDRLELYQLLCIGAYHAGVGDFITAIRWAENGDYLVDVRFEPYN
ncbi:MAG: hypothetical protein FWG93_06830 [Oscillospiraceae bacterium]|nr:hypothetical protein [Oscillospiraceae bacterium]